MKGMTRWLSSLRHYIPDLHSPRPVTHVLPEKQIIETARTQVVEYLTEDLADDLRVEPVLLERHVELGQEGKQLVQRLLGIHVARSPVKVIVLAACPLTVTLTGPLMDALDTLVLQQSDHEDGLDLLLHDLGDALVDPDCYVGQDPSVG